MPCIVKIEFVNSEGKQIAVQSKEFSDESEAELAYETAISALEEEADEIDTPDFKEPLAEDKYHG